MVPSNVLVAFPVPPLVCWLLCSCQASSSLSIPGASCCCKRSGVTAGSWNWRLVFELQLPLLKANVRIQCKDKDLVNGNDLIGETQISLKTFLNQADHAWRQDKSLEQVHWRPSKKQAGKSKASKHTAQRPGTMPTQHPLHIKHAPPTKINRF